MDVRTDAGFASMMGAYLNQLMLDTGDARVCIAVLLLEFRAISGLVGQEDGGLWEVWGMGGGREGEVRGEGRIAPAPGSLPSVGYNLTALSQDTCRAKTRHPTKTGACGDILVRAKPPMGLERCQKAHKHTRIHTLECIVKSYTCVKDCFSNTHAHAHICMQTTTPPHMRGLKGATKQRKHEG